MARLPPKHLTERLVRQTNPGSSLISFSNLIAPYAAGGVVSFFAM